MKYPQKDKSDNPKEEMREKMQGKKKKK